MIHVIFDADILPTAMGCGAPEIRFGLSCMETHLIIGLESMVPLQY
jgi:hypothetical protein